MRAAASSSAASGASEVRDAAAGSAPPGYWRISFILPEALYRAVPQGRHHPCLHRCILTVHGAGLVAALGPDLETLREQAMRFLKAHSRARVVLQATAMEPGGGQRALEAGNRAIEPMPLFGAGAPPSAKREGPARPLPRGASDAA